MLWGKVHFFTKKHRHFISVQKTPPFHFLPNTGPVNDKATLFLLSALATVAAPSNGISALHLPCIGLEYFTSVDCNTEYRTLVHPSTTDVSPVTLRVQKRTAVAPPGGRGETSPPLWVDVQKLCKMCVFSIIVMELLRITRQIHCKAVEQRATLIHIQYNRDCGTSYSV